jgi:CubicO group peptidase (beta-lactamase class C family)
VTAAGAAGGTVARGFEGVRAAFDRNLAEFGEGGGGFAAMVGGELAVDLWGGLADPATGRPWGARTCAVVFSGTKGVVATALLVLVERGKLDLSAPVASIWPEFATAGKEEVTIGQLCSHCGGVPGVTAAFALGDLRGIARLLAAQAPIVPIGAPSYHAWTYGWLAAELVARVDGRSLGTFVRDELTRPLGDLDLRIGLDPGDPLAAERAQLRLAPGFRLGAFSVPDPDPRLALVYNPPLTPEVWNDPGILAIEVPAAGGVATARALATLYGRLAGADGPLAAGTLELGRRPVAVGDDPLTGRPLRFGPTGYELPGTPSPLGPPADAFGHTGAGGSTHGAWPSLQTGFSYVTAEMRSSDDDGRAELLLAALHEAVTAL